MLRASAVCEAAGVPSSSLIGEGFMRQAAATTIGLGMRNLPFAMVPGHPTALTTEELKRNILEVTLPGVIENLTQDPAVSAQVKPEPRARDIIFSGGFKAVNHYFYEHELSDSLPIVPPVIADVEAFLRFTDRAPDAVLGIVKPDNRAATVWSVAVNGVMAGCLPEHMPILVAVVEAMVDPKYGVEHSGNTPSGETLILLNGPIIKELGFNYSGGVLRDGFLPNTTIGRFWRLYLRNVAGFLPQKTDKATYGNTWRVVGAENEDALAGIGWEPICAEMGYARGDNTVMIARYTGGDVAASVTGSTPEEIMPFLADVVLRQAASWQLMFTVGPAQGTLRPLLLLTPILAETIARAGWSKMDVKRYLYDHARIPAWKLERQLRDWTRKSVWNLKQEAELGNIPKAFYESDDPERMVPVVSRPEDFMIAVTGDLLRNDAYVFAHNGLLGYPVAKTIQLPANWAQLLAERG
ncbi:MAG: hypothetical protein HY525_14980 [Betaproteobacteria bacterium]|nr:hypothetical protein [Betaproteobacteria bacterium]